MTHTAPRTPPKLQPGDQAPDFTLPATDDSLYRLADHLPGQPATVVLFICNHCPYVQAYIPRLIALQKEFEGKAGFLAINANDASVYAEDSFDHMKEIAWQWKLNFPYLRDESQEVAKAYGAQRTPEVFVVDRKGVCRYEGGVDDNYQDAANVKDQPLRDALTQLVAGRPVTRPQTWAIGCTIKWKKA